MIYIGIDPGLTGALAFLDGEEVEFFDAPTYQDGKRTRLDAASGAKLLSKSIRPKSYKAFMEKVGPTPQMGVTSAFNFGHGYGIWEGILASFGIPFTLVTPQAWKKTMMAGEAKEKDASRIVARRLFPVQCEEYLSRVKDHGRADALLIAEYGRRMTERGK